MKLIVTSPPPPDPDAPWWAGRAVHCDNCGGDFALEASDGAQSVIGPGPVRSLAVNCARCRALISYSEADPDAAPPKAAKAVPPKAAKAVPPAAPTTETPAAPTTETPAAAPATETPAA